MLNLPTTVRVFFATDPCDMRKQMNGLSILVQQGMDRDARSGDLYVFRNRRGDMLRALFRDAHGFCLLSKRLDRGAFRIALSEAMQAKGAVEMTAEELGKLMTELSFRPVKG